MQQRPTRMVQCLSVGINAYQMRGSSVQHLYDLTTSPVQHLLWISDMDNSFAEVLSFQHIHKSCSGRVDSIVDVFLGLDTALNKPLRQSD